MITYDQAMDDSVTEFHIAHSGQPCTVWRRAGLSCEMINGGFFLPIFRNEMPDDHPYRRNSETQWHHITGVNAGDFHVADDCPHARSDSPPVAPDPALVPSDQSEDGRDADGFDADGYDVWGYDRDGYDANGYDSGGYDADGYDADGYDASDHDADGDPRPGTLDASDLDLADLWGSFTNGTRYSYQFRSRQDDFREHLRSLVRDPGEIDDLEFCGNCDEPAWYDDLSSAQGGSVRICDGCWDDWMTCDHCNERYPADDMTEVLDGSDVCDGCRSDYYSYCEECDGYYDDNYADDHGHGCGDESGGCCESPQQEFRVRNDGDVPLANDTRTTIMLPAGTISTEGIETIARYLRNHGQWDLSYDLDKIGDTWQARSGNFAKRLSRHAYQAHQAKLTPEVMSQVGCIARDHSNAVSTEIEVTRDLNLSAYEFGNEGSCYWGSYYESRCALKTNGGFGLRSFDSDGYVSGRAWVMPLRQDETGKLVATFDTLTPDAFVVFNGYGDLSSYAAPRIVAHMAGWTYRKIGFSADPMYINAGGYLVAPEDIAGQYTDGSLYLSISQHSHLFETEKKVYVDA